MPPLRRILLADDSELAVRSVRRLAAQYGYEIVEALNGTDVVRIAAETQPELIVLDVQFPDADGRDILAELKADGRTAAIPVVIWSGAHADSERKIVLDLGAEDYIEKADAQTLFAKIKRVLLRIDQDR
jgi:two-component system KDP operon response regulator KdpE